MGKIKIPIIITLCVLIMFILTGYLFFRKDSSRSNNPLHTDRDTVAASVVSGSAISKSVEKSVIIHIFLLLMNMMIVIIMKIIKRIICK